MVRGMRTRHIIARWLGYHTQLAQLRSRCALLEEQRHGARTRSTRNLARAAAEKRRADAATVRLAEADQALRDHEAQVQALLARCRANRAAIMEAEDRMGRAHTLVARARHTMNINPKGARAMLDQAVGLLGDDR